MPPKRKEEIAKEKQRLYKKRRRAQIKNDPDLLAIEREKRRAQYLRYKEAKKITSIKEKSSRSQKEQRKKWRENSKKYRQRKQEDATRQREISFEDIQVNFPHVDLEGRQSVIDPLQHADNNGDAAIRKLRYTELKKRKALLKIIQNLKKRNKTNSKVIRNLKNRLQDAQKQIETLKTSFSETQESNDVTNTVNLVGTQDEATPVPKTVFDFIKQFYLSDMTSYLAAGKKEFITKDRIRMQKRYLRLPLKQLYAMFLSENRQFKVSYSFFCKHRPFWVVFPREVDRDTCQCSVHTNMQLLISALNRSSIILEKDYCQVLSTLCCDPKNTECLQKTCNACSSNDLKYNELQKMITVYEWKRVKRQIILNDGTKKDQMVIEKQKNTIDSAAAISKFKTDIVKFLEHTCKIVSQYTAIKKLKDNLNIQEALIHVDFSENYSLKYATEVQSFHFGGSRQQVSLHTAVLYSHSFSTGQVTPKSMCTISDCLRHDAPAVWAHIEPLIEETLKNNNFIDTIHFLSDSPTSQYRNKYLFYMLTQFCKNFPQLRQVTWNYSEAGHGKGAPDGVGATLKRTADRMVVFGQDIGTFNDFYDLITGYVANDQLKIGVKKITQEDILRKDNLIPKSLKPFRGTFSVYQVLWEKSNQTSVTMRTASCFSCNGSEVCVHGKHLRFHAGPERC